MVAAAGGLLLLAAPALADTPGSSGAAAGSPSSAAALLGTIPPSPTPGPSISGTTRAGSALTLNKGGWAATTRVGQRWIRCNAAGAGCIYTGIIGTAYPLGPADVGARIKARVRRDTGSGLTAAHREVDTALTATVTAAPAPVPGAPPAAVPVSNEKAPSIRGSRRQGKVLRASRGSWGGTKPITYRYRWLRCEESCRAIPAATRSAYRLKSQDIGEHIQLAVTADNRAHSAVTATSKPTGEIVPRKTRRVSARVTIAGRVTGRGVVITRFRVRAERGASIRVTCRGKGCPLKRAHPKNRRRGVNIRRLQRRLRGGISIAVRVTKRFKVGKYTRLAIRRGRVPTRIDRCLRPGRSRPVRC